MKKEELITQFSEVINMLLDWLEEEHMGLSDKAINEICTMYPDVWKNMV